MGKSRDNHMKEFLKWILLVSMSPIAILVFMLMALLSLLRFIVKTFLLLIIVAITTPFAVMYNVSIVVIEYNLAYFPESSAAHWYWSDPRASGGKEIHVSWKQFDPRANAGVEVQVLVSDFIKVVYGELLLVMSTGIITLYTAPKKVFYISTVVWVVAVLHKWLNTNCLSKIALSCLCGGYGLNPMMFLFSFIGLFDIGCHPVAKCSFVASKAYLFVKDAPRNPYTRMAHIEIHWKESGDEIHHNPFKRDEICLEHSKIDFFRWDAFERGLFKLNPRIDFIKRAHGGYILKSFMVLKLRKVNICEYPVESLELPEGYSKTNELYNFLVTLSLSNSFVTDKMRGRYEQSLTLLQIVEGVEENWGYNIVVATGELFVVAGCIDLKKEKD